MKRLFTLLAAMIVVFSFTMPVFAQKKEAGQAHEMHAKNTKKRAKKHQGKKKGQQETNPGQKESQETPKQ